MFKILKELVKPKGTWENLNKHYLNAINDKWYISIAELDNLISYYTNIFYFKKGIKTMHLPITTGSISSPMGLGSDSSPVKIQIQNKQTYLADSMQFMLEYGCRIFEKGAYYIMPSFRGELADKRHLCQFYHSEAEIPGDLNTLINLIEEYLKYLCENILKDYGEDLIKITGGNEHIEKLISIDKIPQITFEEAVDILKDSPKYVKHHSEGYRTITSEGEKKLIEKFDGFVWLKHFDYISVPFYQAYIKEENKAKNADLLFGIGEIVGCGQRHENGKQVMDALKLHNVDKKQYEWYINLKTKYPMLTSGFGMGIERFILWLTKHDDIRDCQIVPRFNGVDIVV